MANAAPGFVKNPDHKVEIRNFDGSVQVSVDGVAVASSNRTLLVEETGLPPVSYLPLEDVDSEYLSPSGTSTYCPYKGHASYWSLKIDDRLIEDALWAYEEPYDECSALKGYVAFYANKADVKRI
jgi:uncharacterized protein (DUF427 family)